MPHEHEHNNLVNEPTVGPSGNAVCANGQVVSRCNKKENNNGAGGFLGIGSGFDGILGGAC